MLADLPTGLFGDLHYYINKILCVMMEPFAWAETYGLPFIIVLYSKFLQF